jgi:hypothetical protein
MSGGAFGHEQWQINHIVEQIQVELERQGQLKPKSDLYMNAEYYDKYPEEKYYETYSERVQEKMREAIKALRIAYAYANRIDYFLSADDGEENFLKRLEEELNELNQKL